LVASVGLFSSFFGIDSLWCHFPTFFGITLGMHNVSISELTFHKKKAL